MFRHYIAAWFSVPRTNPSTPGWGDYDPCTSVKYAKANFEIHHYLLVNMNGYDSTPKVVKITRQTRYKCDTGLVGIFHNRKELFHGWTMTSTPPHSSLSKVPNNFYLE